VKQDVSFVLHQERDARRKGDIFCLCYISKTKQNVAKKDRILFNTHINKPGCKIWSCFADFQFKLKISDTLFLPNPSIL